MCRTGDAPEAVRRHVAQCLLCQTEVARLTELAPVLARPESPSMPISPGTDRVVLAAIERGLTKRPPLLFTMARRLIPAAAAAVIVGCALLWLKGMPMRSAPDALAGSDLNRDGAVDILDALLLAREVERGTPRVTWDVTRDGRVDAADIEAVARQAVTLEQQETEG